MKPSEAAIRFLSRSPGRTDDAVAIALGKKPIPPAVLKEGLGEQREQTQVWHLPDQDALNRFCQYLENQLGLSCTIDETNNGSQGGYVVKVTGTYADSDIASVIGSLRATRLDNMAGQLA